MPKRDEIDPELIHKVYLETKNGREVARRLNIHENTVYQILRRFKGTCRICTNPVQPGEINCPDCKKKVAERRKKKRAENVRKGLCVSCNEPKMPGNRLYCQACLIKHNERNERYYDRQKAKTNSGLNTNERQRIRYIRSQYGKEAVKLWLEQDGTCVVCGVKHNNDKSLGRGTVHIHHIDENRKNHSSENLVLLCYDCHTLVTRLMKHSTPGKLLEWTKKIYPDLIK